MPNYPERQRQPARSPETLLANWLSGEDAGLPGQADDSLDLVRQAGGEVFREIGGLAGAGGGQQPAEADLPDSERVKQDFSPRRGSQGTVALPGDRVEHPRVARLGDRAGEQDQSGSLARGVVIDLQGLPEADD